MALSTPLTFASGVSRCTSAGWTRSSTPSPAIAADGEVLDDEAEALGEAVVDRIDPADALGRDAPRLDARAEREHRQDDELVRRVVPVDVERGIGLGVALGLRLADGLVEAEPVARASA